MRRGLDKAVSRLRAGGHRLTVQRRAVLEALGALRCAHTAEEIHMRARRTYPRVGLVTVYRTLEAFTREGLAHPVLLGDGPMRFELTEEGRHHHHLVCLSCGSIQRIDECGLGPVERVVRRRGFEVTEHRMELFGYCQRCRVRA